MFFRRPSRSFKSNPSPSVVIGAFHGHQTVSATLGGDLRFVNNTATFDGGKPENWAAETTAVEFPPVQASRSLHAKNTLKR